MQNEIGKQPHKRNERESKTKKHASKQKKTSAKKEMEVATGRETDQGKNPPNDKLNAK